MLTLSSLNAASLNPHELARSMWRRLSPAMQARLKQAPVVRDLLGEIARLQKDNDALKAAGLQLWVPPGHYYSPLPDLADVRANEAKLFDRSVKPVAGVDLRDAEQVALLHKLAVFQKDMPFKAEKTEGLRYWFNNDYFAYSDGIALYGMLRHLRPARYIEIGSGYSSALALDVNQRFFGGKIQLTFIEPYPERLHSLIKESDSEQAQVHCEKLQDVDLRIFDELDAGDVLFVDSTHISKIGSDVNLILFEILPRLRRGVHVHFHDIFFPFEYMKEWVYQGRAWNEDYLLRAFLQYNSAFEIVLFNHYLAHAHAQLLAKLMPLSVHNSGGSLWLRRS